MYAATATDVRPEVSEHGTCEGLRRCARGRSHSTELFTCVGDSNGSAEVNALASSGYENAAPYSLRLFLHIMSGVGSPHGSSSAAQHQGKTIEPLAEGLETK